MSLEARTMKSEVNLLSLLSTFDDVLDALPEEKEGVSQKEETVKLPRTNSLEDLGIKVCRNLRKNPTFLFCHFQNMFFLNTCTSQDSGSPPSQPQQKKKPQEEDKGDNKKWAIHVDITSPCDDFYKRVPDPAFKVRTHPHDY